MRFLGQLDFYGGVREVSRNVVNWFQLKVDARIRRAMLGATHVLAANSEVAADLERAYGVSPAVQLETGISAVRTTARPPRDPSAPLKILWAGRLRSWKGLPLLLRALVTLPPECCYSLRVLGQGDCLNRWRRLAERLGIGAHVEWVGWPEYAGQLPHYEWADVFAFTSLRDTSGTGLLESLAAGAPIIALDHQGAADIVNEQCGVRIPVTTPAAAIAGFGDAVGSLARDAQRLQRLSDGARRRAYDFLWERSWRVMRSVYRHAIEVHAAMPLQAVGDPGGNIAREMPHATEVSPVSAGLASTPQEALC